MDDWAEVRCVLPADSNETQNALDSNVISEDSLGGLQSGMLSA